MTVDSALVLAALAVGHLAVLVTVVNVVHGLGLPGRVADRFTLAFAGASAVATAMLAAWAWRGPWPTWPAPVRGYGWICLAAGLVVLPACTLARALRRRPRGIAAGPSEAVDLPWVDGGPDAPVGVGKNAWMLRLPGNESLRLRKVEWEVGLAGLHPALDGLSLVQLSDFHFSQAYDRRYFEAAAAVASEWDADLIAFTGDLLDDEACLDWAVPVLGQLRGRLGQFSILGNHDFHHEPVAVRRALRDAGFSDLDGRWTRVSQGVATLALGGTSAPWGPELDPIKMPEADARIVLSHTPDRFYRAASWGVDLVLSGHNHGGQIRLPGLGPVLMPSIYGRRFDRGFYRQGRTTLYVSQGLGGKHPLRFGGCSPEISRLVLRALPANPADRAATPVTSSLLEPDPTHP